MAQRLTVLAALSEDSVSVLEPIWQLTTTLSSKKICCPLWPPQALHAYSTQTYLQANHPPPYTLQKQTKTNSNNKLMAVMLTVRLETVASLTSLQKKDFMQ